MALPDRALVDASAAFLTRQAAARDTIAGNTLAAVTRLWAPQTDPADVDATTEFAAAVLVLVQGGQRQTADVTGSFLRLVLERTPDADAPLVPIELPPSLRGFDAAAATTPYLRPFAQWRSDRAQGADLATARDRAYRRLMVMTDSDLTAAMREASRQTVADNPAVTAMRRVPRPELSRGGACGLCLAAADRLYGRRQLMPIHTRCNCESLPVTGGYDSGLELNREDFTLLYGPDGDTSPAALKRVRFVVSEHGEHGPTLRRAGDNFRGPGDVAA